MKLIPGDYSGQDEPIDFERTSARQYLIDAIFIEFPERRQSFVGPLYDAFDKEINDLGRANEFKRSAEFKEWFRKIPIRDEWLKDILVSRLAWRKFGRKTKEKQLIAEQGGYVFFDNPDLSYLCEQPSNSDAVLDYALPFDPEDIKIHFEHVGYSPLFCKWDEFSKHVRSAFDQYLTDYKARMEKSAERTGMTKEKAKRGRSIDRSKYESRVPIEFLLVVKKRFFGLTLDQLVDYYSSLEFTKKAEGEVQAITPSALQKKLAQAERLLGIKQTT